MKTLLSLLTLMEAIERLGRIGRRFRCRLPAVFNFRELKIDAFMKTDVFKLVFGYANKISSIFSSFDLSFSALCLP